MVIIRSRKRITKKTKFLEIDAESMKYVSGKEILAWAANGMECSWEGTNGYANSDKIEIEFEPGIGFFIGGMKKDFIVKRAPDGMLGNRKYLLTVYFEEN